MKIGFQNLISILSAFCIGVLSLMIFSVMYFYDGLPNTLIVLPIYSILISAVVLGLALVVKFLLKKRLHRIRNTKKVFSYTLFLSLIFYFFSPFFGLVSKYSDYEAHQHFNGPNWIVSLIAYFMIIFSVLNFLNKKNENFI